MTAATPSTGPEPIVTVDDTTAGTNPDHVTTSEPALAEVAELLGLCEDFLRTGPPTIRAELGFFLARADTDRNVDWVPDRLGFQSRYLHARLATSRRHASTCPSVPPEPATTPIAGESR